MTLATEFVAKYGENYNESGAVIEFLDKHCMFTFQAMSEPLFLLFYVLSDRSTVILVANLGEQKVDISVGEDVQLHMNYYYKDLAFHEMFGTVN